MYDDTSLDIIDYHASMLLDEARTGTYFNAIQEYVEPGDVVLDLGCGTGIMSYFACMAGAERVYAIEHGPILELAKVICEKNGFQDRVTFINGWSYEVDLPEKVDLIICETIGSLGFEEGILTWLADARRRFLASSGRVIPQTLELLLVPVEYPEYSDYSDLWKDAFYSLDLSPFKELITNSLLGAKFDPEHLLADPISFYHANLREDQSTGIHCDGSFQITREGTCSGLGGWFNAQLAPGIFLTNSPSSDTRSWYQVFFPFSDLVGLAPGDKVVVNLKVSNDARRWRWEVSIQNREGAQIAHFVNDTFAGTLRQPG